MARKAKTKLATQAPLQVLSGNNSEIAFEKERSLEPKTSLESEEQEPGEQEPDITVFRPDREGVRKVLGDLEADVMEYIWDNVTSTRQWLTVRDVFEDFRVHRVIAYTTVMSTMARLGRKHLLRTRKVDGAYVYTPSLSKEEFINNFVSRILENLLVSFSHSTEDYLNRVTTDEYSKRLSALKAKMATIRQVKISGERPAGQAEPGNPPSSTFGSQS